MAILTIYREDSQKTIAFTGVRSLTELLDEAGYEMDFPCGRKGRCGKCLVEAAGCISPPDESESHKGKRLACRLLVSGNAEVRLPPRARTQIIGSAEGDREKRKNPESHQQKILSLTAAADIGTTTVAVDYYDNLTGDKVGNTAGDNSQQSTAADVIGRIEAAMNGRRELLKGQITECLLEQGKQNEYINSITEWIITGNTTMLTLLTGRDPEPLSRSPFLAKNLFDETIEFLGKPAYLPPCVHAFFGADAVCSVLYSGVTEKSSVSLLCDIGTNGEIILWKNGRGWAASVAAGPAMEGAGIRRGCRGISGAIDRVTAMGGTIMADTIGHRKAVGICGSGLLDAAACGLDLGLIRPDGSMDVPMELRDGICLYPEDIRALQLAKSALRAGLETLLYASETRKEEVSELILCGGFGKTLNPLSAARIGLIPGSLLPVCRSMGNAALAGAGMLRDLKRRKQAAEICGKTEYISLADRQYFHEAYIRYMMMEMS